jgi:hypothetical protein
VRKWLPYKAATGVLIMFEIAGGIILAVLFLVLAPMLLLLFWPLLWRIAAVILVVVLIGLMPAIREWGYATLGWGWGTTAVIAALVGLWLIMRSNHPALDTRPEVRAAYKARKRGASIPGNGGQ